MRSVTEKRSRDILQLVMLYALVVAGGIALGMGSYVVLTHDTPPATPTPVAVVKPKPAPAPVVKPVVFTPDFSLPETVNGLAPVITHIDTKQPVVFLGIDDGAYKDPEVVQLMHANHIKASLYLSKLFIGSNPDFFKQLTTDGSVIENHTLNHDTNMVRTQSYAQQKQEICGMADFEEKTYGKRPRFFRPPGGAYSTTMQKAAHDCGMSAIVTWIAKANGGSMQYQIGSGLRPGDIVLMHFRPEFKRDLQAFIDAMNAANLHTELLESALPPQ